MSTYAGEFKKSETYESDLKHILWVEIVVAFRFSDLTNLLYVCMCECSHFVYDKKKKNEEVEFFAKR